ncbi:MAG TPA: biosynthetic arginine decarboxylase [Geopsychrobacteraceae bacterium]
MSPRQTDNWTPDHSADLYGIRNWGGGNFDLNRQGEVTVKTRFDDREVAVSLIDIVTGLEQRGHVMPLLLRIENLLDARITLINETFRNAMRDANYHGEYRGVFPVKVNQQRQVIEEITRFGARYGHGLEAGSKAELVLAIAALPEGGQLILNGYKDREFIDLGLWATRLGYRCFFVIETPAELQLLLERSKAFGIKPLIGVRIKISSRVGGLWTETSGDRSSFGLSTTQLVEAIDSLKQQQMLDCLQLLHCHLGSQIPDLQQIRTAVLEASRFYVDLVADGAPMGYIDFGGGLAVDYTGGQTTHVHSRNYSLADYCASIVEVVKTTLDPRAVPHPHIVTESGRATVAHTSLLLFNVLNTLHFEALSLPEQLPETSHALVQRLAAIRETFDLAALEASYQEALDCRDAIRECFRQGEIGLRERSLAENMFLAIAQRIASHIDGQEEIPAGLTDLQQSLADIYYGNFSVFQSLPDSWAIDQLFPVMPIHRHCEAPVRDAIISDLTCDCDGKLDNFILAAGESRTLPLHPLRAGEDYLLGVFLMGAYQETMGDLHNLLGDTHVASVRINEDGSFDVMKEIVGDSIADVLSYVEYQPQGLLETFREKAERAVRQGRISVPERQQLVEAFAASLRGYTYYEK